MIQSFRLAFIVISLILLWTDADSPPPERLTAREIDAISGQREKVRLPVETHLITPTFGAAVDPKYRTKYTAVCYAYLLENGLYVRRFAVHATDKDALPLARSAARLLSVIWFSAERRFGTLCHRLRAAPVDVWLTRSGQAGGEQVGTSIYIYDVTSERSGLEWARELAHEYGHYLLPGASGYSDPESWSNGLLGERMFLRWIREDLAGGKITPEMLAFARPEEVSDYCEKQPEALIERVRRRGIDGSLLAKRDALAMDEFCALMLFSDATYGPRSVVDLLDFMPPGASAGAKAQDFLSSLTRMLASSNRFSTKMIPGRPTRVLLPAGTFTVTGATGTSSVTLDRGTAKQATEGTWTVTVSLAGWRQVGLQGRQEVNLVWVRL